MTYRWRLDVPPPILIDTEADALQFRKECLRRIAAGKNVFAFDTETTGLKIPELKGTHLDWMNDTVTFWSLCWKEGDEYKRFCLRGEHFFMFGPVLENPDVVLITWNGKYDAHVSFNSGIYIWNATVIDAMVMGYLYDENLQGRMDLKTRTKDWIGIGMTKYKDLFGTHYIDEAGNKVKVKEFETDLRTLPVGKVANYASLDAYSTYRVYEFLVEELQKIPLSPESDTDKRSMLDHFYEIELPITEVLWRMERRGLGLDVEMLESTLPVIKDEVDALIMDINRDAGRPINVNSTPQLRQLFFGDGPDDLNLEPIKKTDGGAASTDKEVLTILGAEHPIADNILKYRSLTKFRSTYIVNLVNMANHFDDMRIHPNFNQHGARTGRFSSNNPNSMNFPRPDNDSFGIRRAFIARDGYVLVVADYAQLEIRIMAHFSRDQAMIDAIERGMDLHCVTAARMYGVSYDEMMEAKNAENPTPRQKELKLIRQRCKVIGFGIFYGRGAQGLSADLGISFDEADLKIHKYLYKSFPGVGNFVNNTKVRCKVTQYVRTLVGRRRRLYEIDHRNFKLRAAAEREAVNAIIQGSASDIIKGAMIRIEYSQELNDLNVWMTNQIHDELTFEVPEDNAERSMELIQHYMENPFGEEVALRVPLPVDIKKVANWAEAK